MTSRWEDERVRAALYVYVLADTGLAVRGGLIEATRAALQGGATLVQLRAKVETTLQQIELARALMAVCRESGVPFVVNDRVDVALAAGADGVHVGHMGEEDMLPDDARRLMGDGALIGVSVGSAGEAEEAFRQGADYVSAGPMYGTTTKGNAGPAVGAPLLRAVRAATAGPLVAIGGITVPGVPELLAAGADGVCAGSAVMCAADPESAARAFLDAVSTR